MAAPAWVAQYGAQVGGEAVAARRPRPSGGPPPARGEASGRGRQTSWSASPTRGSRSRSTSSDNLFVDVAARSRDPSLPRTSSRFLDGLRRYELEPLETIDEAVGFAKSGVIRKGSVVSGVFTLVASAMGAGCLSLPHMFRQSGLGLGLLLLACGAALAHVGLVVLMSCARYTECKSFAELVSASAASGAGEGSGRSPVVDAVIALYGLAAVLIYMMLIGDFFGGIVQSAAFGNNDTSRQTLILSSLLVVLPLSVPKSVTALRYISIVSTASIAFMTAVVMIKTPSLLTEARASGHTIQWFRGDACTTLQSFSIALFSFNAHTNAVPVATALDHPRPSVIWQVSLTSVIIEIAFYSLIAACGYLSFLDETEQDFIRNYSHDDGVMLAVRCVYAVPVVLGVPINLSPAVASMKALAKSSALATYLPSLAAVTTGSSQQATRQDGGGSSGGLGARDRNASSSSLAPGGGGGLLGMARHVAIIVTVLGVCTAVAVWCEAIADVIALFGSCFGTLICLVWPRKIYHLIFGRLHSKSIGVPVGLVLFLATLVGVLAFALQAFEFARRIRS